MKKGIVSNDLIYLKKDRIMSKRKRNIRKELGIYINKNIMTQGLKNFIKKGDMG